MKKKMIISISIIAVLALVLTGCSAPTVNKNREPLVTELNSFDLLSEFVSLHSDRTSGDDTTLDAEKKFNNADRAGLYISQKFTELGYLAENGGMIPFKYENPLANNRIETAYNVVFKKDNPTTDNQVIIMANYDNAFNLVVNGQKIGAKGVYKNATGVVALLQTAKLLYGQTLPYDVVFVALGAGEIGHAGSRALLTSMSQEMKNNTLLAVNYNGVSGGDYIYMYADEVKTEHYDYFYNTAVVNNYSITNIPLNKRQKVMTQLNGSVLMHYNYPMTGDNQEFTHSGINTLSYISANLTDRSSSSVSEMKGKDNINYTQADTIDNMIERMGGGDKGMAAIASDIDTVCMNTLKALSGEDFVAVMGSSKVTKFDYTGIGNYTIMQYVGLGVAAGIICILVAIYFAFKSKLTPHDVIIDTVYGRVNASKGGAVMDGNPAPTTKPTIDPFGEEFAKRDDGKAPSDASKPEDKQKPKPKDEKDIFGDF